MVRRCTPTWAAGICNVPAAQIERAAEILGSAERLLSTVLQGVYQSHQATAAAVQVINNLHLLRGMLGRPGCGLLQMNGRPSAENTRECGADGDLPGFRNWQNPEHVAELAEVWNVTPQTIPHYAPPTPAMQIFRYAEQGSIRMLWISGTNPAVSLPELSRSRSVLAQELGRRPPRLSAGVPTPACCSCTTCATCTWRPPGTPCTGRCSPRRLRPPGTSGSWRWRPTATRRRSGRCAGPTP